MKKVITILSVLFITVCFAQKDVSGTAVYISKTSLNVDGFGRKGTSEQQKKRFEDKIKSMLEKIYTLTFNKTSSLYKENERLETNTSNTGRFDFSKLLGESIRYRNLEDSIAIEAVEILGKNFLISDVFTQPNWQLTGETKQIGSYTCFKATYLQKDSGFVFFSMRKKPEESDKEEEEQPKEVLITAWFTPQIPVKSGPAQYWGLPGLILELNTDKTTILCTEIVLNTTEKLEIKAPNKGEKITRDKYNKLIKAKIEEARTLRDFQRKGRRP